MTPVPALWSLSTDPIYLAVAQLIAGMTIATWELAVMLTTLEVFDEDERTSLLSVYTLGQWGSGVSGSFVGGAILDRMPKDHFAFSVIFIASTVARGLVTLLLMRTHRSGLPVAKKN